MYRYFLTLIFAVTLLTGVTPARASGIAWRDNSDAAQIESHNSGKLMMIDFFTTWCGWCTKLDRDVYTNARVANAASRFVTLRLNAEKEGRSLARQFNVSGYPTILFVDSTWHEVNRIVGFEDAESFADDLDTLSGSGGGNKSGGGGEISLRQPGGSHWSAPPTNANSSTIPVGKMAGTAPDPYLRIGSAEGLTLANRLLANHNYVKVEALVRSLTKNGHGEVLGAVYNALGDAALAKNKQDAAWGWYVLTTQNSASVPDLAHAYLAIAQYNHSLGNENRASAALASLTALEGVSPDILSAASDLQGQIKSNH